MSRSHSESQPENPIVLKHDRTAWLKGGDNRCLMPPRTPVGRVWRIILLGAPGIGKATQAELLCERTGACYLQVDEVFRTAKCMCEYDLSPAMQNAVDYLNHSEPVPDETILNVVGERLRCLQCSGGFVLDGFPRTVAQAKALEQVLDVHSLRLTKVIQYELSDEKLIQRISGRRVCLRCKAVFHLTHCPPKVEAVCDLCGDKLVQHEIDRLESVQLRLEAYASAVRPLLNFYRQENLLLNVSAEGSPREIFRETMRVLQTI